MSSALVLPRRFASLVKIEHTVFALPFAYIGALLAVHDVPSAHDLVWITLAMVGARSLAMGLNRLIDAEIDARNPRTAGRELPAGLLSRAQVTAFCALALALYLVRVLPARPDRALAVADPARRVRRLPVPQAVHLAQPPVARRRRRARAGGRMGRGHGRGPVGGVGARRRRRGVDRRIRLLLLAVRPRRRSAAGTALGCGAVRRARCLLGRAALARC